MRNVSFFSLDFRTVLLRFYLMMAIIIMAGFSGYWLVGLLALPVFLSVLLGVSFDWRVEYEIPASAKSHKLPTNPQESLSKVA